LQFWREWHARHFPTSISNCVRLKTANREQRTAPVANASAGRYSSANSEPRTANREQRTANRE
jgi:hypothetical protein